MSVNGWRMSLKYSHFGGAARGEDAKKMLIGYETIYLIEGLQ
jgi:hypothetical protein